MKDGTPIRNPLFREDGTLRLAVDHKLVTVDSLKDPLARAAIPPLQEALEAWRFQGDASLLLARLTQLPRAHTSMNFIKGVYADLTRNGYPFMVLSHEPSFSAEENRRVLSEGKEDITVTLQIDEFPRVLKTVSVKFPSYGYSKTVLVSGVGDFRIEKDIKQKIALALGLSAMSAKKATVNPSDFDTTKLLGLIPGVVKPILEPDLAGNVFGICYMRLAQPEDFVIVSVSPIDSMIFQVKHFETHFATYATTNYQGFELQKTPEFDLYRNNKFE